MLLLLLLSRFSCVWLCATPINRSPPGSPVLGILQARTLEWVAISFSNAWRWKVKVKSFSHARLLVTPWTAAHHGFSRQEYWSGVPGVTGKFGLGMRNEAGQTLIEFCQENAMVIANIFFQQHRRRLHTWTSPDGQHWNQIDYILCRQRWRSSIQSTKTRPGTDCGSDHELLIAKFTLKLKKVGKTARQFRYDLSQIPYDYRVEVRKRFKDLDLIDRVPDDLFLTSTV